MLTRRDLYREAEETRRFRLRYMAPYNIELIARNRALKIQIWRSLLIKQWRHVSWRRSMRAGTNADNKMLVEWISLGVIRWTLSSISKDVTFIKVEGD